tara:strand:- start:2 stop:214 length:213 start_codon:yes stop_codon:yes gene_type:complete
VKPGDLIKFRDDAFQYPLANRGHNVGMVITINTGVVPLNEGDVYMTALWPDGRLAHSFIDARDLEVISEI